MSISRYLSCHPHYSLLEALPPEKSAFNDFNNQTLKIISVTKGTGNHACMTD